MNFSSPSDFQYVQGANIDEQHPYGDLNRIEIDNYIMPVRNTEDKRKLRGIDIAFLMEAVEERARAIGLEDKSWTFSRNITLEQVNEIIKRYNDIVSVEKDYIFHAEAFIKGDIDSVVGTIYDYTDNTQVENMLIREKIGALTDPKLILNAVGNIFDSIAGMRFYQTRYQNSSDNDLKNENATGVIIDWWSGGNYPQDDANEALNYIGLGVLYYASSTNEPFNNVGAIAKLSSGTPTYQGDIGLHDYAKSINYLNVYSSYRIYAEMGRRAAIFPLDNRTLSFSDVIGLAENVFSTMPSTHVNFNIYMIGRPIYELRDRTRWDVE